MWLKILLATFGFRVVLNKCVCNGTEVLCVINYNRKRMEARSGLFIDLTKNKEVPFKTMYTR